MKRELKVLAPEDYLVFLLCFKTDPDEKGTESKMQFSIVQIHIEFQD